jgi:hypothetical protein
VLAWVVCVAAGAVVQLRGPPRTRREEIAGIARAMGVHGVWDQKTQKNRARMPPAAAPEAFLEKKSMDSVAGKVRGDDHEDDDEDVRLAEDEEAGESDGRSFVNVWDDQDPGLDHGLDDDHDHHHDVDLDPAAAEDTDLTTPSVGDGGRTGHYDAKNDAPSAPRAVGGGSGSGAPSESTDEISSELTAIEDSFKSGTSESVRGQQQNVLGFKKTSSSKSASAPVNAEAGIEAEMESIEDDVYGLERGA